MEMAEEMFEKKKAKNGPHKGGKRVTTGDSLHQFLCHFPFCTVYSVAFIFKHISEKMRRIRAQITVFFAFNSRTKEFCRREKKQSKAKQKALLTVITIIKARRSNLILVLRCEIREKIRNHSYGLMLNIILYEKWSSEKGILPTKS